MKFFILLSFLFYASALYEDQAGKFDWFKQYIGKVDHFFIEKHNAPSRRIVISSNNNVHSAINLMSGKIEWRQSLKEDEKILSLDYCKNYLITLNSISNTTLLKVWDTIIGVIVWEKELSEYPVTFNKIKCKDDADSFYVLINDNVQLYNTKTGLLVWQKKIEPSNIKNAITVQLEYIKSTDNLLVVLKHKNIHEFITFDTSGKIVNHSEEGPMLKCTISNNDYIYCLHADKFHLFYRNLIENDAIWKQSQILTPLEIDDENDIHSVEVLNGNTLILTVKSVLKPDNFLTAHVYNFQAADGNLILSYSLENYQNFKRVQLENEVYLVSLRQSDVKQNNCQLNFHDMITGKVVSYLANSYTMNEHHGYIENMDVVLFRKKDSRLSYRLFLITQDQALHFWNQNGNVLWMREESLANVAAVEMLDLPVSDTEAKMDEEFGHNNDNLLQKFVKRITTQLSQIMDFLEDQIKQSRNSKHPYSSSRSCSSMEHTEDCDEENSNNENTHNTNTEINNNSSQYNLGTTLRRDSFNLHKMLVLATTSGKIFGMESSTGRIVWRYLIRDTAPLDKERVLLFIQRTTAHFPHPPEAILLTKDKSSDFPIMHTFNPITGLPRGKTQKLNYRIFLAAMLSLPVTEENSYNKPVLILDKDLRVHIYPSTFQLSLNTNPIYLYRVDDSKGFIYGYEVIKTKAGDSRAICANNGNNEDCYIARQNWQLYFGAGSQKISATAFKSSIEQVHSVGRILSDRNVLYKYLNPNLLAVATESLDINNAIVTIYLVDVVTGKIIYSTMHKKAGGPVNLVQSENWIVYSFQNLKSHRTEIAVLELYEPYEVPESILSEIRDTDVNQLRRNSRISSPNKNLQTPSNKNDDFNIGGGFDILSILGGERATTKKFSSQQRSRIESKMAKESESDNNFADNEDNIVTLGPVVLKQSYIMPTFIRKAAVSITEKGITSKSVLISMESGGVLELPKAQLDPRRSLVMNQELLEEGVEPYIPEILIRTTSIINYNHSVSRVRNIYAGPSGLESTSLVFVYGLDLFFTQIAPSKMFDVLKEDFDHLFIATVMIGMIVGAFVTQRLAARRALYKAWQ